jgi:hypothetical protein
MIKTVLVASLAAICAWTGTASETPLAQANLTQPLNIDLTATIAGATATKDGVAIQTTQHIHLTTADVIAALAVALGTAFPTNAQLLLTESSGGTLTVGLKEGTNAAVDVTGFFVFDPSSNYIESVSFRTNMQSLVTKAEALETFGLQNDNSTTALPWHCNVSGVATITYAGIDPSETVTEGGLCLERPSLWLR